MKEMEKVNYEQCLTSDTKNNKNILITTGATINDQHYLTTQMVVTKFKISENSLRKLYVTKGKEFKDYFYSDARTFLNERFLFYNKIKTRKASRKTAYNIIEAPKDKTYKVNTKSIKGKIISEIKKMNWDDFITIATTSYMSREDWDIAIMKYTDILAKNLGTKNIRIAYSTELSIDIKNKYAISKYDDSHCHIHFFLFKDGNTVDGNQLKNVMLKVLGKSKFRKWEYFAEPFRKEFYVENYILKTHNKDSDCFSMCAPDPSLVL
jgi:hypothetical protein